MIPIQLTLSGFLSYQDPVTLDFTRFELACISGYNGAGKSSLLDAITWALFGIARKRDESLINAASSAAEVALVFQYEGNTYRVQRTLPRGKTSLLEFHLQQSTNTEQQVWRPLTERTLRETQSRIEQTLRLDYDTFVNASFFLQGKADQFTQQRPGDRKRILASILGLEAWEVYRQRTADRRKGVEAEIAALDGRLAEIAAELAEEEARKKNLASLKHQLTGIQKSRQIQEKNLAQARKTAAALGEQRKLVDALARQLDSASRRMNEMAERLATRQTEKETYAQIMAHAPETQRAYADWQQARADIEQWDQLASQFRQHEKRRQPFLDELNAARARLLQEQQTLIEGQNANTRDQQQAITLEEQAAQLREQLSSLETQLAGRAELERQLRQARERQADTKAENPRLKTEMDQLKNRIDQLSSTAGAQCPLCGQPLSENDRQKHITELTAQGKTLGDRFRANLSLLRDADQQIADIESRIAELSRLESKQTGLTQSYAVLRARLEQLHQDITHWADTAAPRLDEINTFLKLETFNPATRQALAALDAELAALGYDAAAHDEARRREQTGRTAEADLRSIENAQAALKPLDEEIANLQKQMGALQIEIAAQQAEYDHAAAAFAATEAAAPDLLAIEDEWMALQEQENHLRLEVGAAQQKVLVLDDLKTRRTVLTAQREELATQVGHYKLLERAFGKDGVPALLIEQALPQIEGRANELLDRLSGGTMTVRFITQAAYKDKKRDDLKETLDIQISDSAGTREYEMFSGGEAFRVNFAVRLALSEVLAQRAGARLQTLVIDEGFGSQDAQGRQRLVEAINLVKPDFAKILVITHIDELKDAFPSRIEVEKTERGSLVQIIAS